jgi:dUTP pyrophosphatase
MLNREEIRTLIATRSLIRGYCNLETQLTPNGFDLTAQELYEFDGAGALDFSNKERAIPGGKLLVARRRNEEDQFGWWELGRGIYKVVTNETVTLPNDLIGIACTRSSLLRMGAFTQTGVWDAGFTGRSEFVLVVENPHGVRVKQNARVVQLMFTRITETAQGYDGIYKNR